MASAKRKGPGLRTFSKIVSLVLALSAATLALSLIVSNARMRTASRAIRDSMSSVRRAQDAALDLFAYAQTSRGAAGVRLENEIRGQLALARQHAEEPEGVAALDEAATRVDDYFAARRQDLPAEQQTRALAAADDALDRFVMKNVDRADAAREIVVGWGEASNVVGIIAGILILVTLAVTLWWIRRFVVGPIIAISDSMEQFGAGAINTRADERGADEVRRMASHFNAMASTLARTQRARLSYLAGVAHDLRNPLAALQLSIAALDPETLPPPDRMRRVLQLVQRQVTRLNRMVSDLLESARIEAGHLELRPEKIDARQIVQEAVALFEGTSPVHPIELELSDEELEIHGDPLRLEQVLSNLLSNAIKYSPEGGTIRVATRREGKRVLVSVADHGRGIAGAELTRIWEPFQRGGSSTEAAPGVGLGLWIVRRIVEAHGGQVSVESERNTGSVFTVSLPLLAHRRTSPEAQVASPAPPS